MGLFLRQDEQRSDVQKRVATELQERLRSKPNIIHDDSEPEMLKDQHTTRSAGMVIIVLIALLFIALIFWAIRLS